MKATISILLIVLTFAACQNSSKSDTEAEIETPTDAEWTYLFDGSTLDGWRAYNGDSLPPGWVIVDKTLTFDTEIREEANFTGGKDIIYGAEEFDNFELSLEWKIPEGGNSGIFLSCKRRLWRAL